MDGEGLYLPRKRGWHVTDTCALFTWLGVVGLFGWAIAVTVVLANTNDNSSSSSSTRKCPLVYEGDETVATVTESQMIKWAALEGWAVKHPTYVENYGCICDKDPDPTVPDSKKMTPVWIAPCDLRVLFPSETQWPSDFPVPPNDCGPNDHVKVCLSSAQLETLWKGKNGVTYCYEETPTFQINTGWDGDLYCCGQFLAADIGYNCGSGCYASGGSCLPNHPKCICSSCMCA